MRRRRVKQASGGPIPSRRASLRHRRHRLPRGKPRALHHGLGDGRDVRRPDHLRPGASWRTTATSSSATKTAPAGILYASQMSVGEENNLRIRVYGTKAGLEWQPGESDRPVGALQRPARAPLPHGQRLHLRHRQALHPACRPGTPRPLSRRSRTSTAARPAPWRRRSRAQTPHPFDTDFPTVFDGARGVHFIHKAIESGEVQRQVARRALHAAGVTARARQRQTPGSAYLRASQR